jgi:hypothetical protein
MLNLFSIHRHRLSLITPVDPYQTICRWRDEGGEGSPADERVRTGFPRQEEGTNIAKEEECADGTCHLSMLGHAFTGSRTGCDKGNARCSGSDLPLGSIRSSVPAFTGHGRTHPAATQVDTV